MTHQSAEGGVTHESTVCPACGEVHDPRRCRGHVDEPDGSLRPCRRFPLRGAKVCTSHGAAARQVRSAAGRKVAMGEVERQVARLGGSLDVEPLEVMLGQVREAAANVAVYRGLVGRLAADLGVDSSDEAIALPERVIEFEKGGTHVPARPHIFVAMYDAERDRLTRTSKLCLDAGVDERRVRIAEVQGQGLARVIQAALDAAFGAMEAAFSDLDPGRVRGVVDEARVAAIAAADASLHELESGEGG